MAQELITLYKLIVLYMLNRVDFPLTQSQISDFMLEKEYTNYMNLQQVFSELTQAGMANAEVIRNRTHMTITPEGKETLRFFENRINDSIRADVDHYLREKGCELRDEVSVFANFDKAASGEYEVRLVAKDRGISLIDMTLSVPTEALAERICNNWQEKNQDIYSFIMRELN